MTNNAHWPAIYRGATPVDISVVIPGSKSVTNRALILAAQAKSPTVLSRPLVSRDSELMVAGLKALGICIEEKTVVVNGIKAKAYAYCDPSQMSEAAYKRCGIEDIGRVGGYLMFTTKPVKALSATEIQVQGIGGITYAQLVAVAKSLKTVKASGRPLAQVLPPIMIDPLTTKDVSVRAGSSIVLTVADPAKWSAEVLSDGIVSFVPGGDQGGFITNPALKALISGATTVKLVNSDDPTQVYQLEIIVNP